MKNRDRNRSGFSLVELMAGALAASVLAITAGTMVFHAYNGWTENSNAVNLHLESHIHIAAAT